MARFRNLLLEEKREEKSRTPCLGAPLTLTACERLQRNYLKPWISRHELYFSRRRKANKLLRRFGVRGTSLSRCFGEETHTHTQRKQHHLQCSQWSRSCACEKRPPQARPVGQLRHLQSDKSIKAPASYRSLICF